MNEKRKIPVMVQTVLNDRVVAVRMENRNLQVFRRADGTEYIKRNGQRCELIRGLAVTTNDISLIGVPMHHDACPRRIHPTSTQDAWDTNLWTPLEGDVPDTRTYFPEGFTPPRTCTYCGAAHPDDALALMRQGWLVEGTGKQYKRYLQPPRQVPHENDEAPRPYRSPVPAVKVYSMHFTEVQIEQFNFLAKPYTT
jgi:hypothetical protein